MHRVERWREVIQGATDEQAVARLMREYVAAIPDALVAALPPECQRALVDNDIQGAAITILHCELSFMGEPALAQLLHEIAHAYASASMRIARVATEPMTTRSHSIG